MYRSAVSSEVHTEAACEKVVFFFRYRRSALDSVHVFYMGAINTVGKTV